MNYNNFLMAFLQADKAKKQLESKLIKVEDNFAMQQAVFGWILDNPWIFAFLLQNEVEKRDVPINGVAQAAIEQAPVEIWNKFRDSICNQNVTVTMVQGKVEITGLFRTQATAATTPVDFKAKFLQHFKDRYFNVNNVDPDKLESCPAATNTGTGATTGTALSSGSNLATVSAITTPAAAPKVTVKVAKAPQKEESKDHSS